MPGDLIFFQNTYAAGVSHVGIYIGDGLFIHAENPSTGVTISSVYSGYYAGHYWGSTRLA
jgi:cell wall-associated NlpC family hydrolase